MQSDIRKSAHHCGHEWVETYQDRDADDADQSCGLEYKAEQRDQYKNYAYCGYQGLTSSDNWKVKIQEERVETAGTTR